MMTISDPKTSNSGASKVWADFANSYSSEIGDFAELDGVMFDGEFRDEYVRLPYEDLPTKQECRW